MTRSKFRQWINKSALSPQNYIWRKVFIFLLICAWLFSGWLQIWINPVIPSLIPQSYAASAAPSRIIASNVAGVAVAPSAHGYYTPATSALVANSTEANGTITFRSAGTISNLRIRVLSGNRPASSPRVNFQLNGSEATGGSNPEILLAPGGTPVAAGEYVDSTNTLAISAGDTLSMHSFGGGSGNASWTFSLVGFDWTPTTGTVTHLATRAGLNYGFNKTYYHTPGGDMTLNETQAEGEWLVKLPTGVSGVTIRNLYVYMSTNSCSAAVNPCVTVSVNGATGAGTAPNLNIAGGAGAGSAEDTSNSIIANDGDKISFKVITGNSGTGVLTIQEIAIEVYDATGGTSFLVISKGGGLSLSSTSFDFPLGGLLAADTTESRSQATLSFSATLSLLSAYVKTGNTGTINLKAGGNNVGSPGNVAVSTVTGGAWITDSTNSYAASAADLVNYTFTRTATPVVTAIALTVQVANPAPTLSISQPDGTGDTVTVGDSYNITYTLSDTDDVVTAAFYYDTNGSGLDGTAISGACASAAEGTNATCSWDTTGVTPGDYYVYGITSDGFNPQVSAYSPGVITIQSASGTLSVDIVDSGGSSVTSPSLSMSTKSFSLVYQTSTGTLGISSQKIRVDNTTANAQWTLTVAADSGPTALWSAGTPKYDFNDPTASAVDGGDSDSYGGQLTISPSVGTITPKAGCNNTGLSLGSSGAFSEGVTDSITLITAGASAGTNCYWDLTDVSALQTIPREQTAGSYSIDMTLTVTAN